MEKWKKIYGKCKIRARNVRFEDVLVLFNHFGIRLAKEKRTKKGSHYLFSHPIVEKYEQRTLSLSRPHGGKESYLHPKDLKNIVAYIELIELYQGYEKKED